MNFMDEMIMDESVCTMTKSKCNIMNEAWVVTVSGVIIIH